ncbi:hypothetical protein GCM10027275_24740 [Rhabdobacter roseus]|uniref:Uncharacterized protein n=1 Tax=Rhabdobacter roseus TaxID=1655419 RepID=A0A840TLY4_9BACT|nr:hypothetical protein [Rhabdobacter roseus]MBB5284414.1 hypothetical protein [Rhabdobacter roseus]
MNLFQLKMLRAALRQSLRDQSEVLTEEEINQILDQISTLTKLIQRLEEKKD